MGDNLKSNLRRLRRSVKKAGSVNRGVAEFAGVPLTELARQMDVPRTDLGMALQRAYGRRYPHVLRQLEVHLNVPAYSLDTLVSQEATDDTEGEEAG